MIRISKLTTKEKFNFYISAFPFLMRPTKNSYGPTLLIRLVNRCTRHSHDGITHRLRFDWRRASSLSARPRGQFMTTSASYVSNDEYQTGRITMLLSKTSPDTGTEGCSIPPCAPCLHNGVTWSCSSEFFFPLPLPQVIGRFGSLANLCSDWLYNRGRF